MNESQRYLVWPYKYYITHSALVLHFLISSYHSISEMADDRQSNILNASVLNSHNMVSGTLSYQEK